MRLGHDFDTISTALAVSHLCNEVPGFYIAWVCIRGLAIEGKGIAELAILLRQKPGEHRQALTGSAKLICLLDRGFGFRCPVCAEEVQAKVCPGCRFTGGELGGLFEIGFNQVEVCRLEGNGSDGECRDRLLILGRAGLRESLVPKAAAEHDCGCQNGPHPGRILHRIRLPLQQLAVLRLVYHGTTFVPFLTSLYSIWHRTAHTCDKCISKDKSNHIAQFLR